MKFVHALIVVIVAITIVVGAFAMLVPVYKKMRQAEQTVRVKRDIHEQLRGEIMTIQQEIHDLEHNSSATEKIAREKFKYCREGEIIYIYSE